MLAGDLLETYKTLAEAAPYDLRMKTTAIVLLAAALAIPTDAADFPTFMTGTWTVANGPVVTEEHWTDAKGDLMLGLNRTVKPGGKTSFEFLRIEMRNGRLAYVAMPRGNPATAFPLKTLTADRVVFENLEHDFPQRIIYWRDAARLCARVEGTMGGKVESEEWCWTAAPGRSDQ